MKYEGLTEEIIRIFYEVYNTLGYGFLEKVYENALAIEFGKAGLKFGQQVRISVLYKGKNIGDYVADFVIDDKVVVEIKALVEFSGREKGQLLNYLRATDLEVGLVLNFGKKAGIKRMVLDNGLKLGKGD